ncbi:hypothetical protein V1511DRAFT_496608 [Dipodascopsis uninucleata]
MDRPSSASASRVGRRTSLQPSANGNISSPSPMRPRASRVSAYGTNAVRSPSSMGLSSPRPPSSRGIRETAAIDFSVGDTVYVPGGMQGVIMYIGPVHGRGGEFAGVDLIGDDMARGKNNGTVDGVRYFSPSGPTSGIFVPLHKISNSLLPTTPSTPRPGSSMTSRTPSRSSVAPTDRTMSPLPPHGSNGYHTPLGARRTSTVPSTLQSSSLGSRAVSGTSSTSSASRLTSSTSSAAVTTPTVNRRRSLMGQPSRLSRSSVLAQSGGSDDSNDTDNGSLTDSKPVNAAIDELKEEIANLKRELTATVKKLQEREDEIEKQNAVLRDMECTVSEFQSLTDSTATDINVSRSDGESDASFLSREQDLRTLLKDKDNKLDALQKELDSKRAEFRETMFALEQANVATTRMYETQIEDLTNKMTSTNFDKDLPDMAPLEAMISDLENSLEERRTAEEIFRRKLDDAQNLIISKDEEINKLHVQIEDLSSTATILKSTPLPPMETGANEAELLAELTKEKLEREKLAAEVHNLEKIVESKVFKEQELEKEIIDLREQLSQIRDNLNQESELNEKLKGSLEQSYQQQQQQQRSQNVRQGSILNNVMLNGSNISKYSSSSDLSKRPTCIICGSEDHDIIDCPDSGYNSTENKSSANIEVIDSMQSIAPPLFSAKKPEASRKLWCALCEQDGHSSMDCPNEANLF